MLNVAGVALGYNGTNVVDHLSFALQEGEIGCLLGASGCGKTTALRAIAGFEPVRAGRIELAGLAVSDAQATVPAHERRIGMVFQDYALFPHLTVAGNVAFGLAKQDRVARERRVLELLELVGLPDLAARFPHELSGGQQQRVALARALAPGPRLMLLDEPFSNLDVELRERLASDVRMILKKEGITAVLVTHDQHEAFAVADKVGVMADGVLRQWATPYELYHEPADRFVANFIGEGVMIEGQVTGPNCIRTELGEICRVVPVECCPDCTADVLIRPDDIVHDDASPTTARVVSRAFRGAHFLYTLELPSGTRVLSLVPSHHDHAVGQQIGIRTDIDHVIAFKKARC
ncbi:ABC transporter ATP-binding protein [Chitinibacteraceae bacterium HSL-7]